MSLHGADIPELPKPPRQGSPRVLMLGWEFPPFISGGLGTACHGLSRAVAGQGAEIVFVLPRAMTAAATMDVPSSAPSRPTAAGAAAARVAYRTVPSRLRSPYPGSGFSDSPTGWVSTEAWEDWPAPEGGLRVVGAGSLGGYGGDLLGRTEAYARRCVGVASAEQFDIVHAHDWMTFRAGQAIAARFGKPLVVHVHATEFDRSGEHVHQPVYDLERAGVHAADRVLAVSGLTRDVLLSRYGVPAEKIQVVHNGMASAEEPGPMAALRERRRTVLFLGRVTRQKGPGFFLAAAERVLEHVDDARFIIAGNGDLMPSMIERVAANGLGAQILFTGFLGQAEVAQAYRQADVYVMPSVSEPFGLTALEAVRHGTPTIISRTSGVAEVLRRGALQVDHWDVDGMANGIIAILKHPALAETLCRDGREELCGLSWDVAAAKCHQAYRELVPG